MTTAFKFNLGDKAKDRISGLQGVIVSRAEHLFGCSRYWIQPQETKDGKPVEGAWFDEDSLELVQVGVIERREYRVVTAEAPAPQVIEHRVRAVAGGPTNQPASHARISTK